MIRSVKKRVEPGERWLKVLGTLNEFQARLYVADKAMDLGRGGISWLTKVTGMSRTTITKSVRELTRGRNLKVPGKGGSRQPGGGRKKVEEADREVGKMLMEILEETTAGDPMSALRWTSKSTRGIAEELTRRGHAISSMTVGRYLDEMGYTLQANQKTLEGAQRPERDAQFRYINKQVKGFLRSGDPVISVDTKKKELVGAFKNPGRVWRPKGQPEQVNAKDFSHLGKGKGIPYGVFDIARNCAVVNVGVTHDTAEFAVESVRRWWRLDGYKVYRDAKRLLINADGGGSNGSRVRLWKLHLQMLANEIGIPITVCHYPPGTSKWNKIEHRLFSFISLNWKGRPLVNFETMINLIGATKTRTGLSVSAELDTNYYETGIKVSKSEFKDIRLRKHQLHPEWNYTITPQSA